MKKITLFLFVSILWLSSFSQEKTRILFVFDASNSMNGYWAGERKMETATKLLSATLQEIYLFENLEIGLRVYGHQTKHVQGQQDCDDTELVVPIGSGNNLIISKELKRITPQGTTPIARSLEKAAGDFSDCENCRNVIILITDGIEACDEDPCAVSKALQEKNIIVRPFIIGIGLDEKYKSTFECVGNYFDATNPETFERVLDLVITEALNNTSVQINLNNSKKEPKETNVPFTLYDMRTGAVMYDYVHTLNTFGNPDTLSLDPLPIYQLQVHTLPAIVEDSLVINPGEHTTINIDAAQGELDLQFSSRRSDFDKVVCLVHTNNDCQLINSQVFGTAERYLTGLYDLEILTTPRTIIEDVEIKDGEVTSVVVPVPGTLVLVAGSVGYGAILVENDNRLETAIKFSEGDPGGRYYLQPGQYRLVFRARNARQTLYTLEKTFTIKSGVTTTINLN